MRPGEWVFWGMKQLRYTQESVDVVTVATYLAQHGRLGAAGGRGGVAEEWVRRFGATDYVWTAPWSPGA